MNNLDSIGDTIRTELEMKNAARDAALTQSRLLIRYCANTIKSVHRKMWDEAKEGLQTVKEAANGLIESVKDYPDLYHSGYTQDALKEYVEAFVTYALVRGEPLPGSEELGVPGSTYLNGLAEAASEMRRTILDIIRTDHDEKAERLLEDMDTIYNLLMTFDFPDAITYGLRRRVDSLRGVAERTRGDLTNSLRQKRLQAALSNLEERLKDTLE
ncbi:MAG: haloacid dehalogenase [Anaerolineae bacterium]|nr:haloacid dehalogenase [Anaerolineae bacterium]